MYIGSIDIYLFNNLYKYKNVYIRRFKNVYKNRLKVVKNMKNNYIFLNTYHIIFLLSILTQMTIIKIKIKYNSRSLGFMLWVTVITNFKNGLYI